MKKNVPPNKIQKFAGILSLLFVSYSAMAQYNKVSITGNLGKDFAGKAIYISVFDFEKGIYPTAEKKEMANTEGSFSFVMELPAYSLFKISIGGEKYTVTGIENESSLSVTQSNGKIRFSGSTTNEEMREFRKQLNLLNDKYFAELVKKATIAMEKKDTALIKALEDEKEEKMALFKTELEDIVAGIKSPVARFDAIGFLDENKNREFIFKMTKELKTQYPQTAFVKNLEKKLIRMQQNKVGTAATAFTITDINGNKREPQQYKGKYLLIDFWASWCLPCRIENPKLLVIYNSTPRTDFDILSLSQDKEKDDWIKAIEKDGITWTQANDADKTVADMYGVSSLPQNVLLNRHGVIIAKNISSEELAEILSKELKI